jgi:uncharacterized membrane protein
MKRNVRKQRYHQPSTAEELISRNVDSIIDLEKAAQADQTPADRVADTITRFCGSMFFVWFHVGWFVVWIVANTIFLKKPVDPFPFNFLTLVVSLEAIFLSTFILISENRQSRIDERRSHLDLQINLLSEQESTKMLRLLKQICEKMDIDPSDDPTVEMLEKATRPDVVLKHIKRAEKKVDASL